MDIRRWVEANACNMTIQTTVGGYVKNDEKCIKCDEMVHTPTDPKTQTIPIVLLEFTLLSGSVSAIPDPSDSGEEIGRRIRHGQNVTETKAALPNSQRKHIQQADIETAIQHDQKTKTQHLMFLDLNTSRTNSLQISLSRIVRTNVFAARVETSQNTALARPGRLQRQRNYPPS